MAGQTNGAGPGSEDDRKLFVGGLGRNLKEKDVTDYFSKFGEVETAIIKLDQNTGESRGFGFVTFKNAKVIEELLSSGPHYIGNRKIDPKKVTKKEMPLNCKVFVGGLTPDMTDTIIQEYFAQYGTIKEFQAPFDKKKKQRKSFCFITFETRDIVNKVLKSPKQLIDGKLVDVKKVKFNPETMGAGYNVTKGQLYPIYGIQPGFPVSTTYTNSYQGPNGYGGGYDGYENYYGGYTDYAYGPYSGSGFGFQGGYNVVTGAPTGGGKFRDNQFPRHQPY